MGTRCEDEYVRVGLLRSGEGICCSYDVDS